MAPYLHKFSAVVQKMQLTPFETNLHYILGKLGANILVGQVCLPNFGIQLSEASRFETLNFIIDGSSQLKFALHMQLFAPKKH